MYGCGVVLRNELIASFCWWCRWVRSESSFLMCVFFDGWIEYVFDSWKCWWLALGSMGQESSSIRCFDYTTCSVCCLQLWVSVSCTKFRIGRLYQITKHNLPSTFITYPPNTRNQNYTEMSFCGLQVMQPTIEWKIIYENQTASKK